MITLTIEISIAPKKPSRPNMVRPASIVASPTSSSTRRNGGGGSGRTLTGWSYWRTWSSRYLWSGVGVADLAAAVARGAMDQPGADRVHPADAGQVEIEVLALQPLEPGRQHAELRQRQVAVKVEHPPAVLVAFSEPCDRAHSGDMLQFPASGKVDKRGRSVLAEVP